MSRLVFLGAVVAVVTALAGPAVSASAATTTIEDTNIGTGLGQVSYSGIWTQCGGCVPATPNRSFRYSNNYGDIATLRFSGTQINIYGIMERNGGRAAISVDGGTPTVVDTFALTSAVSLIFSSGSLAAGTHTATITNLHQRNAAAISYTVGFDRAEVSSDPTPPPPPPTPTAITIEDTAVGTGNNQVSYGGTWYTCGGCVPTSPNKSFRYSLTAGATANIHFTGTQINIYGIKEPHGGFARVTIDNAPPVPPDGSNQIDTYAPASILTLLYSSPTMAAGAHTLTLANLRMHNVLSDAYVVAFDRAEVTVGATAPPPPPPPMFNGPRSGLPWLSGANGDPLMTPARVDAFCNFRGTPCDLGQVYVPRNNWGDITGTGGLLPAFVNWPGRMIISIPPYPSSEGNANARCAAGAFDSYWRTFGQTLNSYGRQDSFLRLAWEANGNWYPWSGTNPADFIGCWRHVADAINATAEPDPNMCWCINSHYSQNPPSHNALDLYPGDAWVDGVGFDAYDQFSPSRTKEEFDAQAIAPGGITNVYNFARAHNKFFGVGEWGVVSGSGSNGGGDSANYVQWMHDWFVDHAGKGFAYEYYFNNCEKNNVGSNLYRPLGGDCFWTNPKAADRYRQLW
jgi:hypothetical protein